MSLREATRLSVLTATAALFAAGGNHLQGQSHPTGGKFIPPSPPVTPFVQELHRMPVKTALPGQASDLEKPENGGVAPNGMVYPQVTGIDALTTYMNSLERIVAPQQRNYGNNVQFPPEVFYVLRAKQAKHIFHPDAPYSDDGGSTIWGYDGIYPGPTFISRHNMPVLVRIINELYDDPEANPTKPEDVAPGAFGDPRISTHLHNGHTGSESDGNPTDIYPPVDPPPHLPQFPSSIRNIRFRDHHYPMFRAGLDPRVSAITPPPNVDDGDPAESLSTLWYHDHSMDHTAENVYKGLVGYHLVYDEVDSGDENDASPTALRLPSGEFDVPLLFQDKRFDGSGQLMLPGDPVLDPLARLGLLGDRFTVNGQIQPKMTVQRRKYRFRLLNAGPSRFYQFFVTKGDVDQEFFQIGNDETLLPKRATVKSVLIAVAERADVIIDFSEFRTGDKVFLVNRLIMHDDGFGPKSVHDGDGKFVEYETLPAGEGDQILRFDVGGDATDPSHAPETLRANPQLPPELFTSTGDFKSAEDLKQLPNHRQFEFTVDDVTGETWVINKRPFDPSPAGAASTPDGTLLPAGSLPTPRIRLRGEMPDGEVWTLKNQDSGNWAHPIHIHLEEFRILRRDDKLAPAHEQCKKDVLSLAPNEEVQIFIRFRDFLGKYPIHCHNVIHEDHEMMLRFDVVGDY